MSKKKAELTPKQRRYIKERVKNPAASKGSCAIKAGYAKNTAHNVQKVEKYCKDKLLAEMKRARVDDRYLVKKLKEGLEAKKTELFACEGKITDEAELVDYATRGRYLEIAHRLRGDFVEKVEHSGNLPTVVVVMPDNGRGKEEPAPDTDDKKADGA